MNADGDRGPLATVVLVVRALAAVTGVTLLVWAWRVLDNIWTYDDSGTLTYALVALVIAIPGLALVAFAVLADRFRR